MSRDQHALKDVSNTAPKEREVVECTGKKGKLLSAEERKADGGGEV